MTVDTAAATSRLAAPGARPRHGGWRAMLLDTLRYRELLKRLVAKDLKLKYRGSSLGFAWSLANPLLMITVYAFAFTYILGIRREGFVFRLLVGLLAWTFFSGSLTMSAGSIADNGGLLKSIYFPRAVLPVGSVLFNLAQYLLTVSVFFPVLYTVYGVPLSAAALLFPVFLLLQIVFTVGLALMLATGTVFFRDIRHLLEVALAVIFWSTPVLYELEQVPVGLRSIILLSPLSPFVVAYHNVLYDGRWPDPSVWIVAAGYAVIALAAGIALLAKFEDRFAEQV